MIDPYNWAGSVTPENIEQVRESLLKRMPTRHIAIGHHELFSADSLNEGDHVVFSPEKVTLTLIYGLAVKETKTVTIKSAL